MIPLWLAEAAHEGGFFERLPFGTLLTIVIVFLLINGFFVAVEFALVAVRKTKVDEMVREGVRGAAAVKRGKEDVDSYVAAAQLGITVASLLLGAAGEALFRVPLRSLGLSTPVALTLLSLAMMTTLHVVVGEQVPKMLAYKFPDRVSLVCAPVTELFMRACAPAIWVLSKMSDVILRIFGVNKSAEGGHGEQHPHSEEEIQALLGLREAAGLAAPQESEMISRVFAFFDMVATQIMVPRTGMHCVAATTSLRELMEEAAEHRHERYPIYGQDLDDIKGIVLLKDLIVAMNKNPNLDAPVTTLMRDVLCVPGSLNVANLMSQMQKHRTRVAVVLDEFGGTAGMVTYGDLLERIVGEVEETTVSAPTEDDIEELDENTFRVSGLTLIEDFEDHFDVDIDDEHNDTIGGAVFSLIGRKPRVGDQVELAHFKFRVESLQGLRIHKLLVERLQPKATSDETEGSAASEVAST